MGGGLESGGGKEVPTRLVQKAGSSSPSPFEADSVKVLLCGFPAGSLTTVSLTPVFQKAPGSLSVSAFPSIAANTLLCRIPLKMIPNWFKGSCLESTSAQGSVPTFPTYFLGDDKPLGAQYGTRTMRNSTEGDLWGLRASLRSPQSPA